MPGKNLFAQGRNLLAEEQPSELESAFQSIPGAPALSEFASAANRSVAQMADFFGPDAINAILNLAGSESRVPTVEGSLKEVGIGREGFMEPGLARDTVQAAGETLPVAMGFGQAMRSIANRLPEASRGMLDDILKQFGGGTARQDAVTGTLAGTGAELGEEAGQAVGGDTGGQIGRLTGSVVAPLGASLPMILSSGTRQILPEAAPKINELKEAGRNIYRQIDNLGVVVEAPAVSQLASQVVNNIRSKGFNARIHPKVSAALDEITTHADKDLSVSDIDILRRVSRAAARSLEPDEARLGSIMVQQIDDFLDDLPTQFVRNPQGTDVGVLMRQARDFWQRARKAELIEDAISKAKDQASGFENGLRVQFRSLLNNRKKLQGFTEDEKNAMRQVVQGTKGANLAKLIGRLGFQEGQATNLIGVALGITGGGIVGGVPGSIATVAVGQGARKLAQNLTLGNANFASALTRAGKNGFNIAKAYTQNVPKSQQSVQDLAALLINQNARIEPLRNHSNKLLADAALLASVIKNAPEPEASPAPSEPVRVSAGVADRPD